MKKLSKQAEKILHDIEDMKVFRNSKLKPKIKFDVKIEPYRSDVESPIIPSYQGTKCNTSVQVDNVYTGDLSLATGLGYNKGGLQVLLNSELRDSGKKTSQLES